ncbi:unnamed protein product [Heterobilharzia americana]|nr:unnamed protein product [Heterobilharzia americana]
MLFCATLSRGRFRVYLIVLTCKRGFIVSKNNGYICPMSNLNASQILECALKDVDKILKVNGEDSNEGQLIGNNHIDQQNLQSTSSPNSDISLVNDIVKNSGEFCNGNYLYRTGKEFSVLIDRLQNCIDKMNSSQAIVLNHSSRRHDLDRRAQRDNRVRMVRPVTTQINEYNLIQLMKLIYRLLACDHRMTVTI